jgi:hypothetical protein
MTPLDRRSWSHPQERRPKNSGPMCWPILADVCECDALAGSPSSRPPASARIAAHAIMQSRFHTTSVIPGPPCWASHVSRALPPRGDRPEPLLPLAFRPTFNWINALLQLTTAPRCLRAVVAPVRVFGGGQTRGEGSAAAKMHGPPWCLYVLSSTISARLGLTEEGAWLRTGAVRCRSTRPSDRSARERSRAI